MILLLCWAVAAEADFWRCQNCGRQGGFPTDASGGGSVRVLSRCNSCPAERSPNRAGGRDSAADAERRRQSEETRKRLEEWENERRRDEERRARNLRETRRRLEEHEEERRRAERQRSGPVRGSVDGPTTNIDDRRDRTKIDFEEFQRPRAEVEREARQLGEWLTRESPQLLAGKLREMPSEELENAASRARWLLEEMQQHGLPVSPELGRALEVLRKEDEIRRNREFIRMLNAQVDPAEWLRENLSDQELLTAIDNLSALKRDSRDHQQPDVPELEEFHRRLLAEINRRGLPTNRGAEREDRQESRRQAEERRRAEEERRRAEAGRKRDANDPSPRGGGRLEDAEVVARASAEEVVDHMIDQAMRKLIPIPGIGAAMAFTEFFKEFVYAAVEEKARPTLALNPEARLVDGGGPPTSEAQHLASRGRTAWQTPGGIWLYSDDPAYRPRTPYAVLYRPIRPLGDGQWEWRRESGNAAAQPEPDPSNKALIRQTTRRVRQEGIDRLKRILASQAPNPKRVGVLAVDRVINASLEKKAEAMLERVRLKDPAAKLVVPSVGGSRAAALKMLQKEGVTVWRGRDGLWYSIPHANYQPRSEFVELWRPRREGGRFVPVAAHGAGESRPAPAPSGPNLVSGAQTAPKPRQAARPSHPSPPPTASRRSLGVHIQTVDLGSGTLGLFIQRVDPNTPAQRARLEPGDIIVRVDGNPVARSEELRDALARSNGRPRLTVRNVRDGQYIDIEAALD